MSDRELYKVGFHFGDEDFQSVTLATSPDDDESLEKYLGKKLNGASAARFAAFGDGADGFTLINTDRLTKVSVRKITESA